jgi:hypothetical protein
MYKYYFKSKFDIPIYMDNLPNELIYIILEYISIAEDYDTIKTFGLSAVKYHNMVTSWHDKLFTGIAYRAWLTTKPAGLANFNRVLSEHYKLSPDHISDLNNNHIPNIRNRLQYSSYIAIDQFHSLSALVRTIMHLNPDTPAYDIPTYIKELEFLSTAFIIFMNYIKQRIIKQDSSTECMDTMKRPEPLRTVSDWNRTPQFIFFSYINRLNTIICHTCKILNSSTAIKFINKKHQ